MNSIILFYFEILCFTFLQKKTHRLKTSVYDKQNFNILVVITNSLTYDFVRKTKVIIML